MAVYRTQQLHDIERAQKRLRQHGSYQAPPRAGLFEDQVDLLGTAAGKRLEGLEGLFGGVVLQDFLEHDVVERSVMEEQVPEVRHHVGRPRFVRSLVSL